MGYPGAHVNCWDQSFHFAWVSIISGVCASVQAHSSILNRKLNYLTNGSDHINQRSLFAYIATGT